MAAEVSGPALARRVRDTIAEHGLNDLVDAARELDVPEPELRAIVVEETIHPSLVVLASLIRKELLTIDTDPRSPERGQYGFLQALVQRIAY